MYQSIEIASRPAGKPTAIVCFFFDDKALRPSDKALDRAAKGALAAALKRAEVNGTAAESHLVDGGKARHVLVGLGGAKKLDARIMRQVGAATVRALDRIGAATATLQLSGLASDSLPSERAAQALAEGIGLASFDFNDFKATTKKEGKVKSLRCAADDSSLAAPLRKGLALADSTNYARRLAATPPNVATTTFVAAQAQKLARASMGRLRCRVIRGASLEREKLVGLINVGKASENPPCLIELTWSPRNGRKTVLLVGKTICYDTGGLSLKINNGMKGMKYDKNGGMAVLGAMHAIVHAIRPACRVVALLPAAENSISDEAYRPDDIITYLNGVSVEVTNTDAEGRLVLADALAWGCRKVKPDAIIDLATLTGGVVVALGTACAGLFCNDDNLRARIESAAECTGDRVWRLPLWEDYREMMKSKHADIWNSAPVRHAHPIQGAAFLSYFVDEKMPWAHLDIAGTSNIDSDQSPYLAGPTGFGVRLLASVLENWE